MNRKTKNVGERINFFENSLTNDVKTFNIVFNEYKLDLPENELVEIGDLVKCKCYEIKTSSGEKFDHYFERRKLDESIIDVDFNELDDDY